MLGRQHLFYATGILAYAVAKSDGEVQEEERQRLNDILKEESDHHIDFMYAEIIFEILDRDRSGLKTVYDWALKEIRKGRHDLDSSIKSKMIYIMQEVAKAFGSVSVEEMDLIEKFEKDLDEISPK